MLSKTVQLRSVYISYQNNTLNGHATLSVPSLLYLNLQLAKQKLYTPNIVHYQVSDLMVVFSLGQFTR